MSTVYSLHSIETMTAGEHVLTAVAKATGYEDSEQSEPITFTAYSVTYGIIKGSATGYPFIFNDEIMHGTIVPNANCDLPSSITVMGATLDSYSSSTGEFAIKNPTGNVSIIASCLENYSISATLVNATAAAGNPTTIKQGSTAILVYNFSGNYQCPLTGPTVTNAQGVWQSISSSQGTLTLSNPTGAVSFTIEGALIQVNPPYIELESSYSIGATITNGSAAGAQVIAEGATATITITADTGYVLPASITVNGVTGTSGSTGATWTYSDSTGVVSLSNPNDNITITAACESQVTVYSATVSGLGSSSPSSVTFTKDAGFTKVGLGIEEITLDGDTFVKIPTMYRKVNTAYGSQITSFTIANAKIDNDYEPYSCFVDENGNVLPYILIGKYWNTQANGCVSTTEAAATPVTTAVGRANAQNRGTGYQIFDWQMQKLWQDLIICFKETVNTNTGTGWTYDELGIYWTTSGGWVDGVIGSSGAWYLCDKPSKYASLSSTSGSIPNDYVTAGYTQPTTSDQEIQKLGYNSSKPFFNFPYAVTTNLSYNTYYCDGYSYSSGNRPVRMNAGYPGGYCGVFYCNPYNAWSDTFGVRLCFRPLPQLEEPTNVSVSGTEASFDPVENAESYEFFVDGTSIGEYSTTPQPPFTNIKIQGDGDFVGASVLVDGVNITNQIAGYPGTPVTMTVNTSFIVNSNAGYHDNIQIYDSEGGNLVWDNGGATGTYDITTYLNNGYYVYLDIDS